MMTFNIIPLFLGNLRGWEWVIILVVILLLFGGKKIPELMRSMGRGVRNFREGMKEDTPAESAGSKDHSNSGKESE